jgi:hypothetical protein
MRRVGAGGQVLHAAEDRGRKIPLPIWSALLMRRIIRVLRELPGLFVGDAPRIGFAAEGGSIAGGVAHFIQQPLRRDQVGSPRTLGKAVVHTLDTRNRVRVATLIA